MKKILVTLCLFICVTYGWAQTNTSYGTNAGNSGNGNSSYGYNAGNIVTGSDNSFYGRNSGLVTTSAIYNSFYGAFSGEANTTGGSNVFLGYATGLYNTTGSNNTYVGRATGAGNTTGNDNVFVGFYAGRYNTASGTTGVGKDALFSTTSGIGNTAVGYQTLYNNTTGTYNTAIGYQAGHQSTALDNTTALGYNAIPTASNQVRIGNTYVTSIGGYAAWSNLSDGRFKVDVQEDVQGLDFINQLRPVSYVIDRSAISHHLGMASKDIDALKKVASASPRETGFIAQEVEVIVQKSNTAFNGVVAPQSDQDYYSLRYSEFVVPLVKAVQELSALVAEQQKKIDVLMSLQSESVDVVEEHNASGLVLYANSPNPFSDDTEIKMTVPESVQYANLIVYNLEGKQLSSVDVVDRGNTSVTIAGHTLTPGMYIYTLLADGKMVAAKRMILIK